MMRMIKKTIVLVPRRRKCSRTRKQEKSRKKSTETRSS